MQVIMNTGGIAQTNAYIIADEDSKQAVLFDAPDHTVGPLLDQVEQRGWQLIGLWLTHGHFDHIADHAVVKQRFPDATILIHPLEADRLRDPASQNRLFPLPFTIPPGEPDELIEDGQLLRIGSIEVRIMHTPGHAPGHVAFHLPQHQVLIGGDLIMMHSVGRTDLPGSSYEQLQESIRKVMKLPDQTQLLPGHGEPSSLGEERQMNPFVIESIGP